MKNITIIMAILAISTLFVGCASQETKTESVTPNVMVKMSEEKASVKYFEVRHIGPYQKPPVMVVQEGDEVVLNFLLRDVYYYALDNYVEDYFKTGLARFTADQRGEFPIRCIGDDADCPVTVLGYLVVE